MDPNATLDELRALIIEADTQYDEEPCALRFASAFEALDEWLSKGGFLPSDWERK